MCGRFFRHGVSWIDYRAMLDLIPPDGIDPPEPTFNAAPMSLQPVIRQAERGVGYQLVPMVWSLIPSWWKKPLSEKKFTSFNAKCETLAEKPAFRGAYKYRRCLVP
ncbi:MAG: SOS response-associated peptidase family protein, partial [Pseudomonadota bacterium]